MLYNFYCHVELHKADDVIQREARKGWRVHTIMPTQGPQMVQACAILFHRETDS